MNRTERAGWIVLGGGLLSVFVALGIFLYTGPGAAQREIKRLSSAAVFNAVLDPAIILHESLADGISLPPTDARGSRLRDILVPADYSFVIKRENELLIECGGGFLHYGYRLSKNASGGYALFLQVEEKDDRMLIARADLP